MELVHEFSVPVPVEQAWQVLTDVERIAPRGNLESDVLRAGPPTA
jgi:hypothetical protein